MGLGTDHRLSLAQQLELLKLRNGHRTGRAHRPIGSGSRSRNEQGKRGKSLLTTGLFLFPCRPSANPRLTSSVMPLFARLRHSRRMRRRRSRRMWRAGHGSSHFPVRITNTMPVRFEVRPLECFGRKGAALVTPVVQRPAS